MQSDKHDRRVIHEEHPHHAVRTLWCALPVDHLLSEFGEMTNHTLAEFRGPDPLRNRLAQSDCRLLGTFVFLFACVEFAQGDWIGDDVALQERWETGHGFDGRLPRKDTRLLVLQR